MNKNNFYILLGIWITALPFLGIPGTWRNILISLSGIFLVLVSIGPTILKKLQTKPKTRKKKENNNPSISQSDRLNNRPGGGDDVIIKK